MVVSLVVFIRLVVLFSLVGIICRLVRKFSWVWLVSVVCNGLNSR